MHSRKRRLAVIALLLLGVGILVAGLLNDSTPDCEEYPKPVFSTVADDSRGNLFGLSTETELSALPAPTPVQRIGLPCFVSPRGGVQLRYQKYIADPETGSRHRETGKPGNRVTG